MCLVYNLFFSFQFTWTNFDLSWDAFFAVYGKRFSELCWTVVPVFYKVQREISAILYVFYYIHHLETKWWSFNDSFVCTILEPWSTYFKWSVRACWSYHHLWLHSLVANTISYKNCPNIVFDISNRHWEKLSFVTAAEGQLSLKCNNDISSKNCI